MSFNPIYSVLYIGGKEKTLAEFESSFEEDYHVYTAASGRDGLAIMEQRAIQLVIADQQLPDTTGIKLLEKIMELHPFCTRILQSRKGSMDAIVRAAGRGILFQHVPYPWKREDLKITIDGALELYYLKIQNRDQNSHLNEVKQTLEQKVMKRTRQLEQQRENITDSIQYASLIQKALMLPSTELQAMLPPHFILNKPKDIVSGDFFWASRKDGRLFIAVADCTGHGVPGAFMSIMGINFLNGIVNEMPAPRTSDILNKLREQIITALGQTGRIDEAREGLEIALCAIDLENRSLQFSGAFRPLYLIREGNLSEIRGDRMPIGIYGDELLPFTNKEHSILENDIIYLFSDGFVDQLGGLQRKTFRSARFKKLLLEICHQPLKEQKAILREEFEIWRAGQEQIDDVMVMGIQFTAP